VCVCVCVCVCEFEGGCCPLASMATVGRPVPSHAGNAHIDDEYFDDEDLSEEADVREPPQRDRNIDDDHDHYDHDSPERDDESGRGGSDRAADSLFSPDNHHGDSRRDRAVDSGDDMYADHGSLRSPSAKPAGLSASALRTSIRSRVLTTATTMTTTSTTAASHAFARTSLGGSGRRTGHAVSATAPPVVTQALRRDLEGIVDLAVSVVRERASGPSEYEHVRGSGAGWSVRDSVFVGLVLPRVAHCCLLLFLGCLGTNSNIHP
jgi:hypothetical protein